MKKRILSILLCLLMVVCMLPTMAFATGGGAMQLGTGGIEVNDKVYFGQYGAIDTVYDVPWIVLPNTALSLTSTSEVTNYLPLFSKYIYTLNAFFSPSDTLSYNNNAEYNLKSMMSVIYNNFDSREQNAVADTTLKDINLSGQKLFPLSWDDAISLTKDSSILIAKNIASQNGSAEQWWLRTPIYDLKEQTNSAWSVQENGDISTSPTTFMLGVRPALNLDLSKVLFISAAAGGKASGTTGASALTAVSATTPTEWKLTLKDSRRDTFAATTTAVNGNELILSYSGATVGTNDYISAIVKDNSGNIIYYGRVAQPSAASGTAAIDLSGVTMAATDTFYVFSEQYNGDYKTDYTSALVEVSLTKNAYAITNSLTDISSDNASVYRLASDTTDYTATLSVATVGYALPTAITVTVGGTVLTAGSGYTYNSISGALNIPAASITGDIEITAEGVAPDITVPVLTAGAVSRTSDTAATVKFTSDEAGQFYYGIVEKDAAAPIIDTAGTGTACGTTEQTIPLNSLAAGAKDMYIVVKDAAGNVSSSSFKITIPPYVPETYALTVNLDGGNGGTTSGDYAENARINIYAGTKANYSFNGWTSSNGGTFDNANSASTTFTMPGNATTITANWTYNGGFGGDTTYYYTLTFNINGGSAIVSITRAEYTTIDLTLSGYIPTRDGYVFTGWYFDASLTQKITNIQLTANTTIYAGWEAKPTPTQAFKILILKLWKAICSLKL